MTTPGSIRFDVIGLPGPQGSKSRDRHGRMYESSKKVKPWRESVGWACVLTWKNQPPIEGPIHVSIDFWMPRDPARPRARWKANGADLDKLVRATLDGMHAPSCTSAPIFKDDSQVVSLFPVKRPVARQGDPTGASILVIPLADTEATSELALTWVTAPIPTNPFLPRST